MKNWIKESGTSVRTVNPMSQEPAVEVMQDGNKLLKGIIPTRQDSLDLLNNSKAIRKFYSDYEQWPTKLHTSEKAEADNKWAREDLKKRSSSNVPTFSVFRTGYEETKDETININEYYKKVDNNRYYQRELFNDVMDLRAPMTLYDKRITPKGVLEGGTQEGALTGDLVSLYMYPELQVTPIDLLTPDQIKRRQNTYGINPGETDYRNWGDFPKLKPRNFIEVNTNKLDKISMSALQRNLFKNLSMRSLWANSVKNNPNYKIGSWNKLDYNDETKGFTIEEAMKFPKEVKDKYNIDYIFGQIQKKQQGGKVNWNNQFTDFGSRMLHGLQTFGGSYVGDFIQGINPKAANFISKYSAGMISPTPKEYLESNRNSWNNRASNTMNALSYIGAGEVAMPMLGAIGKTAIKKISPIIKTSNKIKVNELAPLENIQNSSIVDTAEDIQLEERIKEAFPKVEVPQLYKQRVDTEVSHAQDFIDNWAYNLKNIDANDIVNKRISNLKDNLPFAFSKQARIDNASTKLKILTDLDGYLKEVELDAPDKYINKFLQENPDKEKAIKYYTDRKANLELSKRIYGDKYFNVDFKGDFASPEFLASEVPFKDRRNRMQSLISRNEQKLKPILDKDFASKISELHYFNNTLEPLGKPTFYSQKNRAKVLTLNHDDPVFQNLSIDDKKYILDNHPFIYGFNGYNGSNIFTGLRTIKNVAEEVTVPNTNRTLKEKLLNRNKFIKEQKTYQIPEINFRNPSDIGATVAHEGGHDLQKIYNFSRQGVTVSPDRKSWIPNKDLKFGKMLDEAMVNWNTDSWLGSPNELHADLMKERYLLARNWFIQETPWKEGIESMKLDPSRYSEYFANNLSKFFKPDTPMETKRKIIEMFPAITGVAVGTQVLKKQKGGTFSENLKGAWNALNTTPTPIGNLETFNEFMSAPQKATTWLASGKYQYPSEAMNIKNPIGALATDAILDPINLVGVGLTKIPGLTKDAPELGFHALNSKHWALHPKSVGGNMEEKGMVYSMAALNRVLPIINKTPLVKPIKKVAERIMEQHSAPMRESSEVLSGIFNKRQGFLPTYTGNFISNSSPRNGIKLYLYGNEAGFKKAGDDILKMDFGPRYEKLYPKAKYYEMESKIPHGKPLEINEPSQFDITYDLAQAIKNKTSFKTGFDFESANPVAPLDNIAGHQGEVRIINGEPIFISQDLWKFNPVDYTKRWAKKQYLGDSNLNTRIVGEKQAAILNKLGKPFYLVQNNPISIKEPIITSSGEPLLFSDEWMLKHKLPDPPDEIILE